MLLLVLLTSSIVKFLTKTSDHRKRNIYNGATAPIGWRSYRPVLLCTLVVGAFALSIATADGQTLDALPLDPFENASLSSQGGSPSSRFPKLPPAPGEKESHELPPLEEELWYRGGSQLYMSEGDRLGMPDEDQGPDGEHYEMLRLPETWQEPRPVTMFQDFLGADPIHRWPRLHWPGQDGYQWDPRLVVYGSYEMFGLAFEENGQRRDGIGHQLLIDLDFKMTATERFHVQYRPIGEKNSGGSLWQFSNPDGYLDNSTATPDRYWFEGEFASILGGLLPNPFVPRDYHFVVGKFPYALHNGLLLNDEIQGIVLSKNTIYLGRLSNLNLQAFYGFNDVDAFADGGAQLFGTHASIDWRRLFVELTFAHVRHDFDSQRESNYVAISATKQFAALSLAGRSLFKWGDSSGNGSGQLFVVESAYTRIFRHGFCQATGIECGVFYLNAFHSTQGWNSISGGNFNRLRSTFEINPLISLSQAQSPQATTGVSLGVQLFRHHEDESIVPEIAFESPGGTAVWGIGLRYLRKTGPRSYLEVLGVYNDSSDPTLRREGVFLSETIVF